MTDNFDPDTGEVLEPKGNEPGGYALDGRPIPAAAATGGDIINMLEEGQFGVDVHQAMADLIAHLNDVSEANGGKAKGSLNIKIDIVKEDNALRIASNYTVKKPDMPRPRSIMWTDQQNNLTMFPPSQMQMFGMRSIGGSGGIRRA
jgi:hypothetical protein